MRWLIRKTESLSANQGVLQDSVIVSDKLTIGADTKADLVLVGSGIEAKHVVLSQGAKGTVIAKADTAKAQLLADDGKSVTKLTLSEGQQMKVGQYTFTLTKAPAGIDYALSITRSNESSSDVSSKFPLVAMTLSDTGFSLRRWSWSWMLLALFIGIILPLLWIFGPQDTLKSVPVLSSADTLWNPGPLAKVHHVQGIADNCQVCHSELFSPVKDSDCQNCHKVDMHLDDKTGTSELAVHSDTDFTEGRCATCHIEHKEPAVVIRDDEPMCTSCHQDIEADEAKESGIAKFELHPQFKLSMLEQLGKNWQVKRKDFDTKGLQESSNLAFSHKLHLDPKGIDGPDGRTQLECNSCHSPEQNGLLIKPITMEEHCSDCHTLSFEPTELERVVPHANLTTVQQSLEEYYSRLYAVQNGPLKSKVDLTRPAKRPGKPKPDFYSSMKEWADDKARDALDELVKNKACSTCHTLDETGSIPSVKPVKIINSWYPKSRFDHSSHEVFECESCHRASESKLSSDILIPDIKNCRSCHAGAADSHDFLDQEIKTISSCMSCHQYHQTKRDALYE
tara:strand:- start:18252 stop:19946 length:1695 start_codon:yes stop_codon:yes gene_type:complete